MKKLIYLLMAMPLLFVSCDNDYMADIEETVEVTFRAKLPQAIGTRAGESALTVDKLYCAVYYNGEVVANLSKEIDIVDENSISFSPRLIKDRTYDVVFWASKAGSYNVADLTAITREPGKQESEYDAFTATTEVDASTNKSINVTLERPISQLNVGVSQTDWNGVTAFGLTPKTLVLKFRAKETYNALAGEATGEEIERTRTVTSTGEEFSCNGNVYKSLGSCFIFSKFHSQTGSQHLVDVTYTVNDEANMIREAEIINVPLARNYKTNIVGSLMTSTVTYTVSFNKVLQTSDEYNKEVN